MFKDRKEAGERLAEALGNVEGAVTVLGMVRGGILVAEPIARRLKAPLEPLVVRKVGAPGRPEFAMGAIAPDGIRYADPNTLSLVGVDEEGFDCHAEAEELELERRQRLYEGDGPTLTLEGKVAIVVDDGLATGATAVAAARYVRSLHPARVVLAVPVASPDAYDLLVPEVDEIVCLERPAPFGAVGRWYEAFEQVSDDEVLRALGRPPN